MVFVLCKTNALNAMSLTFKLKFKKLRLLKKVIIQFEFLLFVYYDPNLFMYQYLYNFKVF